MKISNSNADAWFFTLTQKLFFWRKPDKFNLRETELSYTPAKNLNGFIQWYKITYRLHDTVPVEQN